MRFPLDKQNVIGYDYGVVTTYNAHHLGVDWEADFVLLYAPKNGTILSVLSGTEGGLTIWFRPEGTDLIIRWLHLSKILVKAGQKVSEGQFLAITGNTGTDGNGHHPLSHLHEDMWPKGKVTLNFSDTMNPHEYYKGEEMNQTKVVLGKDGKTVYKAVPIATDFESFKKQAGVEGIEIPNPIPPASSL
jgi:murein DD-endopeptidase MepM/ murein hydrolase activator NlpD